MKFLRYIVIIVSSFLIPYGTSAQSELDRHDLKDKEQSYFKNYIYLQAWGHSWGSLNYFRYLKSSNMLIGGGFGATPDARNFTLEDGGGGVIIQLYIDKQFKITQKFQYGFGIGVTHDFAGPYENILDPFYLKTSLNRYSTSLADDRLYFGASLYYINWVDWSIRPSIKIGISF